MPDVRAKFYVAELTRFPGPAESAGGRVVCRPVSRGAVNASFAAASPSGELSLTVTNPRALAVYDDWRERRREFYLDFTEYTPTFDDGHEFVAAPEGHYTGSGCAECGARTEDHAAG